MNNKAEAKQKQIAENIPNSSMKNKGATVPMREIADGVNLTSNFIKSNYTDDRYLCI
jgi:hypothetical protein